MRRKLFTFFSAVSLLLFVGVGVLWVRRPAWPVMGWPRTTADHSEEFRRLTLLRETPTPESARTALALSDADAQAPSLVEFPWFGRLRFAIERRPDGVALTDRPDRHAEAMRLEAAIDEAQATFEKLIERQALASQKLRRHDGESPTRDEFQAWSRATEELNTHANGVQAMRARLKALLADRPTSVSYGRAAAIVAVLPGAWLGVCGGLAFRSRRLRRRDRCPGCGYDLRATPDRCPECGRMAEP